MVLTWACAVGRAIAVSCFRDHAGRSLSWLADLAELAGQPSYYRPLPMGPRLLVVLKLENAQAASRAVLTATEWALQLQARRSAADAGSRATRVLT